MNLETRIMEDLKTAMREKNQAALRGIRSIKAELLKAKTDGTGREMDEMREVQLLQKMIKQRKESAEIFQKQGDRKSTRLNSSHRNTSRMPSSA